MYCIICFSNEIGSSGYFGSSFYGKIESGILEALYQIL